MNMLNQKNMENFKMRKNRVFIYKDKSDQWRWRIVARNNRKIAISSEGYHNYDDCLHSIKLVLDMKYSENPIVNLFRPSTIEIIRDGE